jgi:hypothetical protein
VQTFGATTSPPSFGMFPPRSFAARGSKVEEAVF